MTAEFDLEEIGDYIARDNPLRALSFVQELRKRCEKLVSFPEAAQIHSEWAKVFGLFHTGAMQFATPYTRILCALRELFRAEGTYQICFFIDCASLFKRLHGVSIKTHSSQSGAVEPRMATWFIHFIIKIVILSFIYLFFA